MKTSYLNDWNADLLDEYYKRWKQDPTLVDPSWSAFFECFELGSSPATNGQAIASVSPARTDQVDELRARVDSLVFKYRILGHTQAAVDPLIQKPYLFELAQSFAGGRDLSDPLISPQLADLTGLPPLLIQVGSEETLLDDSVMLAGRAGAAGVATTLEIWPDMIHAWHLWNAHLEPGRKALLSAGAFIRRHLRMSEAG